MFFLVFYTGGLHLSSFNFRDVSGTLCEICLRLTAENVDIKVLCSNNSPTVLEGPYHLFEAISDISVPLRVPSGAECVSWAQTRSNSFSLSIRFHNTMPGRAELAPTELTFLLKWP